MQHHFFETKTILNKFANVQVNLMTSFNTSSFPDSLAIAKEGSMIIGAIDEIQKLHIRTVHLHEQPRRIAHQEATKSLVVTTTQTTFAAGESYAL
jgi:DNA damage-binding protein 1